MQLMRQSRGELLALAVEKKGGNEMKLELTYDEVSTICHALLLKAEEAATGARECAKLGDMDNDVKFWQERAENYKKVYKAVVAQREQAAAALKAE